MEVRSGSRARDLEDLRPNVGNGPLPVCASDTMLRVVDSGPVGAAPRP